MTVFVLRGIEFFVPELFDRKVVQLPSGNVFVNMPCHVTVSMYNHETVEWCEETVGRLNVWNWGKRWRPWSQKHSNIIWDWFKNKLIREECEQMTVVSIPNTSFSPRYPGTWRDSIWKKTRDKCACMFIWLKRQNSRLVNECHGLVVNR